MNKYEELRNRQEKEFNAFPLGVAFSDKQFAEMMAKLDLTPDDTDKICSLGAGCFIRKSDSEAFREIMTRHERERKEAMDADLTGDGYIYANKERFAGACSQANLTQFQSRKSKCFSFCRQTMLALISSEATELTSDRLYFSVELADHEYGYTRDVEDAFDALGFTLDDINSDQRLVRGLYKAMKEYDDE